MRTVKFTDLISQAFQKMEEVLFRPFAPKKWLRWVLIMVLSGSFAGFCNFGGFPNHSHPSSQSTKLGAHSPAQKNFSYKAFAAAHPWMWEVVAMVGVLFIALSILGMWLSARFKFIWFHVLVHGDVSITQIFGQYRTAARSLFKFYLLNMLAIIGGIWIFICAGIALAMFSKFNLANLGIWWVFIILCVLAVAFLLYWSILIVSIYLGNFMVLIMAMDRCPLGEAWSKFWKIYWENRRDFGGYLLFLILISLVLSIAMGIVLIFVMVGVLLAGLLIFGMLYLILAVFLKLKLLFIILSIIIGIPFFIGMLILIYFAYLPASVFASYFNYYFFSSLNVGYQPFEPKLPPTT